MFLWVERIRNHGLVRSRADVIHMCDATCMAFTKAFTVVLFVCTFTVAFVCVYP